MDRESVSYWADIKKYEDILANDPGSYCFTLLSELYRKLGLLDDAITVANRGIGMHPEYAGGYMAAGRAYFEKGMKAESREVLERVVRVTPDNLLAQKLLCQIYLEQGNTECAISTLKVIELLNPGDVESALMLDALTNAGESKEVDARTENAPAFVAEIAPSEIDFVDDVEDNGKYEAGLLNKGDG
jgi:tetratricopeptide (TPR) repeat protein